MQKEALTVTQLNFQIKNLLEGQAFLQGLKLKGEISNFTAHRSGHLYFALKDENSQVRAIMFQGHANALNFKPKDGDKVTITGNISVYQPQGTYSIQVTSMQIDGAGELYLKYLELKEKLKSLGWFDKPKREIPKYPKRIGVITSPTGAVIQDITNTVNRRYRLTEIILYPALVQGPGSSESISTQIEKANKDNIVDILIVGRGGGSIEDLWGFNELLTITAIYNSKIPVITAIGHETDDTISDLVSDLRAPTPTAAAELATPNVIDLIETLNDYLKDIKFKTNNIITKHQTNLLYLTERLDKAGPITKLKDYELKLSNLNKFLVNYYSQILNNNLNKLNTFSLKVKNLSPVNKLSNNLDLLKQYKVNLNKNYYYIIEKENNRLNISTEKNQRLYLSLLENKDLKLRNIQEILKRVNPLDIMKRGFTITKDINDNILTSIKEVNVNSEVEITFHDGFANAKIVNKKEHNNGK